MKRGLLFLAFSSVVALASTGAQAGSFFEPLDQAMNQFCAKLAFEGASLDDLAPQIVNAGYMDFGTVYIRKDDAGRITVLPMGQKKCQMLVRDMEGPPSDVKGVTTIFVAGQPTKMRMIQDAKTDDEGYVTTVWKGGGRTVTYAEPGPGKGADINITFERE